MRHAFAVGMIARCCCSYCCRSWAAPRALNLASCQWAAYIEWCACRTSMRIFWCVLNVVLVLYGACVCAEAQGWRVLVWLWKYIKFIWSCKHKSMPVAAPHTGLGPWCLCRTSPRLVWPCYGSWLVLEAGGIGAKSNIFFSSCYIKVYGTTKGYQIN